MDATDLDHLSAIFYRAMKTSTCHGCGEASLDVDLSPRPDGTVMARMSCECGAFKRTSYNPDGPAQEFSVDKPLRQPIGAAVLRRRLEHL